METGIILGSVGLIGTVLWALILQRVPESVPKVYSCYRGLFEA